MTRKGRANIATRLIVDDFGQMVLFRRCGFCRRWLPQAIGYFSPRQRDERRRVIRWDNRCLVCRAAERRAVWAVTPKEKRQVASRRNWQLIKADPERLAARRTQNRDLMARRRRDPDLAERGRVAHRAWYRRIKANPKKYAAYLERARMNYRLRQEREGRNLVEMRHVSTVRYGAELQMTLPAKPLADAVDRWLSSRPVDNLEELLRQHGVEMRSLSDWRSGARSSVQFYVVDAALTGLALNWWDVWSPEDYPQVAIDLGMEAA